MAKSKYAVTIAAHVSNELAQVIEDQARKLGWSRSRYIAEILRNWYASGCPPLTEVERRLRDTAGSGASVKSNG